MPDTTCEPRRSGSGQIQAMLFIYILVGLLIFNIIIPFLKTLVISTHWSWLAFDLCVCYYENKEIH